MNAITCQRAAGFTLVELVVTILIAGIMATGVVSYIAASVDGFAAAGNRNKLASAGRTAVDRLTLELHNAVPNSVRVTAATPAGDQCLEFIPFSGASSYLDAPFTGAGDDRFEAINFNPVLPEAPGTDLYAVVYPVNTADLYDGASPGPVAPIDHITDPDEMDGQVSVVLDAAHRFRRRSPVQRFYVAHTPVSFCVVGEQLFRYQGYGFLPSQPVPGELPDSAPRRALIGQRIDNSGLTAFSVTEATLRRNAIISMAFNVTDQGDIFRLKHEVLMRNVP